MLKSSVQIEWLDFLFILMKYWLDFAIFGCFVYIAETMQRLIYNVWASHYNIISSLLSFSTMLFENWPVFLLAFI